MQGTIVQSRQEVVNEKNVYPGAGIYHMLRNALDSVPGRVVERYDSDCSVDSSDLFATALLW